jgi:hypothetical protein
MRFHDGSDLGTVSVHQILFSDLGNNMTETLAMIRQALKEESMSHTWVVEWHA